MKRVAPATHRNREAILAVLRQVLPPQGLVLEVASGTGEHAEYFTRALASVDWQPSDVGPAALASIEAYRRDARLPNLKPALTLDAAAPSWPVERADAVVCINMIHIAPWEACLGLMAGAARVLSSGNPLILYGPYRHNGVFTADSNRIFDENLRREDPRWGVRDVVEVSAAAAAEGIEFCEEHALPANNHALVLRKR